MRAAILGETLTVGEWPEPEPGPGEALVSLSKVGICGSDTHFVLDGTAHTAFRPIILGHEPAGMVEAIGPDTEGPPIGTRVAIIPLITCQECDRCRAGRSVICRDRLCIGADRHGCWADLAAVPVRNLVPIPDDFTDEMAAVATDSVATAFHAVSTQGGVGEGSRVVVWGTGGLGLSAVGIARSLGASTVFAVDPREEARGWALDTGADEALHPDAAIERIAGLGGVDVALEFVGRPETVEGAVRSLDDGGRAVVVGIGDGHASAGRLMTFVLRERQLLGSYGAEPEEVREVIRMMSAGDLSLPHVVGDVIPLDAVLDGVERVARGDTGGSRILVDLKA
ncbi:MAG: zinc-binding dehydrogenase [Actinobacteria bacterium]|nr:zinc-binding dehydrogenase [Actinomycetota bacterium]